MKKIFTFFIVFLWAAAASAATAIDEPQPVITLPAHKEKVQSVAFTKDSRQVITAGLDSFIRFWPLKTTLPAGTIGHGAAIRCMAYSQDGKYMATSGEDRAIKLWDAKDGRLLRQAVEPGGGVSSLVFSPDSGFLAAGVFNGGKGAVNVWKTGEMKKPFGIDTGGNWAKAVAFSSDGTFFLAAGGRTVSVWAVEYGNLVSAVTGKGGISFGNKRDFDFGCMAFDAAFSDDSQYFAACGDDGTVKVWRVIDGAPAWKHPAHNGIALCLDFSKDSLATAGRDGMINLFDIKSGKPVSSRRGCAKDTYDLIFSPDGKYLAAACDDNTVPVWRMYRNSPADFSSGVKMAVFIAGFTGIAGLAIMAFFIFRKKKTVKDWKL